MDKTCKKNFSRLLIDTGSIIKVVEQLEFVVEYEISKKTLLVMAIDYQDKSYSLVLNVGEAPKIVQRSVPKLFEIVVSHSVFSSRIMAKHCCSLAELSTTKLPFLSPCGIFMPFVTTAETCWVNTLHIADVLSQKDQVLSQKNTVLICPDKLELEVPSLKKNVLNRLTNVYLTGSIYADLCSHFSSEKITENDSFSQLLVSLDKKLFYFSTHKHSLRFELNYAKSLDMLLIDGLIEMLYQSPQLKTRREAREHVSDLLALVDEREVET